MDGATVHWCLNVRHRLNTVFLGRWIGRDGPTPWPQRSPNLTPLDFFFFGYVKIKVFEIEKLKKKNSDAVASVTPATLTILRGKSERDF